MNHCLSTLKALSERSRLRVVAVLMHHDELCACQLTELLNLSGATVSRHLGQLIQAGILDSRKEGRWVYYRLRRSEAALQPLLRWVWEELENDSQIRDDLASIQEIIVLDPEDLCRKQRGEACCPSNSQNSDKEYSS